MVTPVRLAIFLGTTFTLNKVAAEEEFSTVDTQSSPDLTHMLKFTFKK